MPANILTSDDLREFKIELLQEIKQTISTFNRILPEQKRHFRIHFATSANKENIAIFQNRSYHVLRLERHHNNSGAKQKNTQSQSK